MADKGYDANHIIEKVHSIGAEAVIPPKRTRKIQRSYDKFLYRERNVIERMFGKMKHFRSISTRYSKLAVSYLEFIHLEAILRWLM